MSRRMEGLVIFGSAAVLAAVLIGVAWYAAWVQSRVYKREGIHMSTWEVFLGAKPAERAIVPK